MSIQACHDERREDLLLLLPRLNERIQQEGRHQLEQPRELLSEILRISSVPDFQLRSIVTLLKRLLHDITPVSFPALSEMLSLNNRTERILSAKKTAILVFGSKGSGKTTLCRYLSGTVFEHVEVRGDSGIARSGNRKFISAKNSGADSEPTCPGYGYHTYELPNGYIACEMPPLHSPQSTETSISSTLALSKLFRKCTRVFPVILIDATDCSLEKLYQIFEILYVTFDSFKSNLECTHFMLQSSVFSENSMKLDELLIAIREKKAELELSLFSVSSKQAAFFVFLDYMTDRYMQSRTFPNCNFVDPTQDKSDTVLDLITSTQGLVLQPAGLRKPVYPQEISVALKSQFEIEKQLVQASLVARDIESLNSRIERLQFISEQLCFAEGSRVYEVVKSELYNVIQDNKTRLENIVRSIRSTSDGRLQDEIPELARFVSELPQLQSIQQRHLLESEPFASLLNRLLYDVIEGIVSDFKAGFTIGKTKAALVEANANFGNVQVISFN